MSRAVEVSDPKLADLLQREDERQAQSLCLIPSENYCSAAVLEANGTVLVNKYSEGYPGRRYYEGNETLDLVDHLVPLVIAPPGISLGVLVDEDGSVGLQNRCGTVVLRGDQTQ